MDPQKYRKSPRPVYYNSASGNETEISLEFETYLILMNNISKQQLISRLRNSLQKQPTLAVRDNLEKEAYRQIARNSGAAVTELDTNLGEFIGYQTSQIQSSGTIPEVSLLLSDISNGFGEALFRREEENYNLVHASVNNNTLNSGSSTEPAKKQVESWVRIISQYMT